MLFVVIFFAIKGASNNPSNVNTANHIVFNNYVFDKQSDNIWYSQFSIRSQPYNIPFYYNPYEVENVSISNESMKTLASFINLHPGATVYITLDPNESTKVVVAAVQLARIFGQKYNILNMDVYAAITSQIQGNDSGTYPVITCQNATNDTLVLYIDVADEDSITSQGNCIIMKSFNANESIRIADAMTFRILRITP